MPHPLAAVLLAAFTAAATCGVCTAATTAEAVSNAAERLLQSGDAGAAITVLRQGRKAHPTDPYLVSDLAFALLETGDTHAAVDALRDAVRLRHPARAAIRFNLGLALQRLGDFPAALQAYEDAVLTAPSSASREVQQAHVKAAFVSKQLGALDGAVRHLLAAIGMDPRDAQLYAHLGDCLNNLKRWPDAISAYTTAVELAPRNADLRHHLGDALLNAGRVRDAAKQFRCVLGCSVRPLCALCSFFNCHGTQVWGQAVAEKRRVALLPALGVDAACVLA